MGWGDPLEEGKATHPSILAWRIPWAEEPDGLVHGIAELDMTEQLSIHTDFKSITSAKTLLLDKVIR